MSGTLQLFGVSLSRSEKMKTLIMEMNVRRFRSTKKAEQRRMDRKKSLVCDAGGYSNLIVIRAKPLPLWPVSLPPYGESNVVLPEYVFASVNMYVDGAEHCEFVEV